MGAGKSAIGSRLARSLDVPFVDLDEVVEASLGMSVAEIFQRHGEDHFRERERDALVDVLDGPRAVIATGGGAVLDAGSRRLLHQRALVVWLRVSPHVASSRVGVDPRRPLLAEGTSPALSRIIAERDPLYREVSHEVVDTDDADVDAVVAEVAALVNPMGSGRAEP